jgi:translation initiation factor 3 subunit D
MRSRQHAKHLASGQARKHGGFKGVGRNNSSMQQLTGQQSSGYGSWGGGGHGHHQRNNVRPDVPKPSLAVQDDWKLIDQLTQINMSKLVGGSAAGEDVAVRGQVRPYVKHVERSTAGAAVALQPTTRAFFRVTTTEDPVLQELAMKGTDQLYATDQVLTHLMTAPRTSQSWDIVVTKIAGKIFLDKRDGSPADLLSVNENETEPPKAEDGEFAPQPLALEAVLVNQKFSQHVIDAKGEPLVLGETPEIFEDAIDEGAVPADVAYRYRRFRLNDGTSVIVRCEIDAYHGTPEAPKFATVRALNEFKVGVATDWRHKLDAHRGAVLAAELKANNAKLARWTASALLAGNDFLTLGYVSRARARTADQHVVLGAQTYVTNDFAKQINVSLTSMWGVVQKIVAALNKVDNGKYLLLIVPGTKALALYSVPPNTFEPEDNGDSEEEEAGIQDTGAVADMRVGSDDEAE